MLVVANAELAQSLQGMVRTTVAELEQAWLTGRADLGRVEARELLPRTEQVGMEREQGELLRDGDTARPQPATRSNPAGLTVRQLEIAALMGRGLTHAETAAKLARWTTRCRRRSTSSV